MEKLTYRQFLKTDVELSVLGVMRVEEPFEPYFCTPKGARIFARSGVDGVCRQPDERAGGLRASGR